MYSERVWKKRKGGSSMDRGDQDGPGIKAEWPTRRLVLTAGALYLGLILLGMLAQVLRMDMIVPGDASATAENIISSGGILEVALVSDIVMCSCFVLLGAVSYMMFRKTNKYVAGVMLLFVVVSGAYAFYNLHNVIEVVQMVNGTGQLTAAEQDLVLAHLNAHEDGTYIAQVLGWGPWLVPLGYLGYRSRFVPKAIGFVLMAGGIGLTAQALQYFLLPSMADLFAPGVVLSIVGEFAICAWFIYSGIKGNRFLVENDERTNKIDPVDSE